MQHYVQYGLDEKLQYSLNCYPYFVYILWYLRYANRCTHTWFSNVALDTPLSQVESCGCLLSTTHTHTTESERKREILSISPTSVFCLSVLSFMVCFVSCVCMLWLWCILSLVCMECACIMFLWNVQAM